MLETHSRVLLATGMANAAMRVLLPAVRRDPAPGSADAAEIAACRLTMARAQVELGMVDNAYVTLDQCEELAGRLALPRIRASVRQARARLHATQERWKEAYEEHVRYHDLALSVVNPTRDARGGLPAPVEREAVSDLTQVAVSHDPLTGLPNRRFVASRLPELLTVMGEHDLPVGVAMIDLDRFAEVNAAAGDDGANEVLVCFADVLERHLGDHQFAARLGGGEFLLVLPAADDALVAAFCEQVRHDLHAFRWCSIHPDLPTVTASFGVAVGYPDDELSQMELLRIADANLYRAKRSGRDTVVSGDENDVRFHQGPQQPFPQHQAAQHPAPQHPATQPHADTPQTQGQVHIQAQAEAQAQAAQALAAQVEATQARLAQVRAAQEARLAQEQAAEAAAGDPKGEGQAKWWNREIRLTRR